MIPRVHATLGWPVELKGSAYDFGRRIVAVEFSLDDGRHWTRYDTPATVDHLNVNWSFAFQPDVCGLHVLHVRSVNDKGGVSPEAARVEVLVERA